MSKPGATITFSAGIEKMGDRIQRTLTHSVLPRAMTKAAALVKRVMIPKLPDGVASGTRAKQTERVRAQFDQHMKDNVGTKLVSDSAGVLKIVGVTNKALQVNFDHGDKAKTVGRHHILWGKKEHTPAYRRQMQDIPAQVKLETEGPVRAIIAAEINTAIATGELR